MKFTSFKISCSGEGVCVKGNLNLNLHILCVNIYEDVCGVCTRVWAWLKVCMYVAICVLEVCNYLIKYLCVRVCAWENIVVEVSMCVNKLVCASNHRWMRGMFREGTFFTPFLSVRNFFIFSFNLGQVKGGKRKVQNGDVESGLWPGRFEVRWCLLMSPIGDWRERFTTNCHNTVLWYGAKVESSKKRQI